jgi:hypothetical protein
MTNGKTRPFQMEDGCGGNYGVVVFESIFVTCTNRDVSKWNTRDGGKNMHMKFRRASAFNQCVYKWNTNGIQMEYKWYTEVVAHMHKMFHGAPLFNQGVFILGVHSMTKRINTNALFNVVGLIDFQVCNRYRAQKNKSTVLKASMKTVSCVLFEFFRRAFRRGM